MSGEDFGLQKVEGMTMDIREYKESDTEEIIGLVEKSLFEIFSAPASNIDDLSNIPEVYFSNGGKFYVAVIDSKVVGCAGVKIENGTPRLHRMFTDSAYRGRGIGTNLLNTIVKFCKDKEYEKITLTTYPQMGQAQKFYKENGFQVINETETILMERIL